MKLGDKINQAVLDKWTQQLKEISEDRKASGTLINDLQNRIRTMEEAMASRGPGFSRNVDLPGSESKFMLSRCISAMIDRSWESAPEERAVLLASADKKGIARKDAERILDGKIRAASLGSDTSLGNLVPQQVMAEIIPILRSMMILDGLGVRRLPNLTGSPVTMNRGTADGVFYWVGENVAITASDPTTDQINLRPHKGAGLCKISNTLIRAGGTGAEQYVRESLAAVLARGIQTAFFNGSGLGPQPLGIASAVGIQSKTGIGTITILQLQKFVEALRNENVPVEDPAVKWAMHPALLSEIEQIQASGTTHLQGTPILTRGDVTLGTPSRVLGIPYLTTTNIPTTQFFLAYWPWTVLADWGGVEIALSSEAGSAFENDQTWVRIIQEVDVEVLQPKGVVVGSGVTVSTAL